MKLTQSQRDQIEALLDTATDKAQAIIDNAIDAIHHEVKTQLETINETFGTEFDYDDIDDLVTQTYKYGEAPTGEDLLDLLEVMSEE